MLRDIRKNRKFNRRALIIGIGQSTLASVVIARLSYLQLFKNKEYSIQSDSNRIKPMINPAPRGMILDRNNKPLTKNNENYRLLIYLKRKREITKTIDKLAKILDLTDEKKELFLTKIKNARRKNVISLINSLEWDDLVRIETNSHLLPGISIESGVMRKYPYPFETAHFIGYVSLPAEREIDKKRQGLFMHPDFRIGKVGIEKTFDDRLRGKYGVKYVEVNANENPLQTLSVNPAIAGSKLNLTIDFDLQKFVYERVVKQAASVLVMDVKTGEILSYVSTPSFNSNNFVEGVSNKYWQELNENPFKPLNNKPISAIYPPGSTFKMMVAIAALEEGVDPEKPVECKGYQHFGRRVFHCWKKKGHGSMNLISAIEQSCNVYFYNIAKQIGFEKIAEVANRFGYGQKFNISLEGGSYGNIPSDQWKKRVLKEPWVGGDTLNAAIGQGFVLATPMQMAVATCRIANGGVAIKPYLVKNQESLEQFNELKNKPIAQKQHLDLIKDAMNRVVNNKKGTAYWRRIVEKKYRMSGKTGTSQVVSKREEDLTEAERKIQKNNTHAIFVGYAPSYDPKYAIATVVDHGGSGSKAAAPVARDILKKAQTLS